MKKSQMRLAISIGALITCFTSAAHAQRLPTDDVVTLIYDSVDGSIFVDNPIGPITTFELTSSEPFFTGPRPPEFSGLFDVWSPTKAFLLNPSGFDEMQWPPGSVETGVPNVREILSLSGSFLVGGALAPVEVCGGLCIPEPSSFALFGIGTVCLAMARRRRPQCHIGPSS